jgi:hypothetical protein
MGRGVQRVLPPAKDSQRLFAIRPPFTLVRTFMDRLPVGSHVGWGEAFSGPCDRRATRSGFPRYRRPSRACGLSWICSRVVRFSMQAARHRVLRVLRDWQRLARMRPPFTLVRTFMGLLLSVDATDGASCPEPSG